MKGLVAMSRSQSPQQIAEKQVRRATGALQDWKEGVQNTPINPMQKAAEAVDQWFAGVQKSYNDGTYVDGLNDTPKQVWVDGCIKKGALTYTQGITDAQATIADFHQQRQQTQNMINGQLAGTPRGGLEQNLQRMMIQARGMSQFKFKKRRGAK